MKQITVPIEYRGKIIGYSEWCAVPIKHKGAIVLAVARRCFTNIRSGGDSWCELQVKRRYKTDEAATRAACRLNGKEYVKPEPTLLERFWGLSRTQREVVYRACCGINYFLLIYSTLDYDANIKDRPSKATIRALIRSGICCEHKTPERNGYEEYNIYLKVCPSVGTAIKELSPREVEDGKR